MIKDCGEGIIVGELIMITISKPQPYNLKTKPKSVQYGINQPIISNEKGDNVSSRAVVITPHNNGNGVWEDFSTTKPPHFSTPYQQ